MTTATTVDWFRFRTQADPGQALKALSALYPGGEGSLSFGDHQKGQMGFRYGLPVKYQDVPIGRMDFGGDSQRGWLRVDIPGQGCQWVEDWSALDAVEALESAQLRRVDLALTTWRGEVTHDRVVSAHDSGQFTTRGRPPDLRMITSSNPRAGRTCYVGNRTADKFFRAYEKGFELAAKCPYGVVTHIDGHPIEGIYRCELELKAQSTDIPWETIERRDQYFAGAYPFCAQVLPGIEPDILQRRPERAAKRELQAVFEQCRYMFGNSLFTGLTAFHGDIGRLVSAIIGKQHNQRLVDAGVLMVDHD